MSAVDRVRAWFMDPRPFYAMIAMRVVLGGSLLGAYLVRLPGFSLYYGADSVAWFPWYRAYIEQYWELPYAGVIRLVYDLGLHHYVWIAYGALLIAALCFCIGFRTRPAGVVALVLHQFFWTTNPDVMWGWALMLSVFMIYTVLAPTGKYLSVDAWLAARRRGESPLPSFPWTASAWPMRLVQINVCTMYAVAGLARLDNYNWREGLMLMDALSNMLYARFPVDWSPYQPILAFLTYLVFVLEPVAPVLLWVRPTAKWIALSLIAMHVGLELFVDIGWWNYVMISALLTFLPSTWLRSAFEALCRIVFPKTAKSEGLA